MSLSLVVSRPDLPPFWDGAPVEWSEWSAGGTSLAWHIPADQLACPECGAVEEPAVCFGKRPPESPTVMSTRTKTTRSGRKYAVPHEIKAWGVRDLIAARCRHCNHDVVTDLRTDERWDLDESDYTAEGSYPVGMLF